MLCCLYRRVIEKIEDDKRRRKPFGNERFPLAFCFYILYTLSVHKNKEVNVREHTKV